MAKHAASADEPMITTMARFAVRTHLRRGGPLASALTVIVAVGVTAAPCAHADNDRLNKSVVSNVYTVQRQAGCTNALRIDPRLQLAAQWHALDVLNNRALDADIGSDGSSPQDRANAAGFRGTVAETVAINPALAINNLEIIQQWYYNPTDFAIMADCSHTAMGVWSENSLDRTVAVAVYGSPESR
jgi:uncharacterized protein YkwD